MSKPFIISEFKAPTFKLQLTPDSQVREFDYYEIIEEVQKEELKLRGEYLKKIDTNLGQTLADFDLEIVKKLVVKIFNLDKTTSISICKGLLDQFKAEVLALEQVDEKKLKN